MREDGRGDARGRVDRGARASVTGSRSSAGDPIRAPRPMRSRWWPNVSRCSSPPGCPHPPHGRTSATCGPSTTASRAPAEAEPSATEPTPVVHPRATRAMTTSCSPRPRRPPRRVSRLQRRSPRRVRPMPESAAQWTVLATAWAVAASSGAPLAASLRELGAALRDEAQLRREVGSALAGPIASARLVLALPLIAMLFGALLGFDTFAVLFGNPLGLACVAVGGALLWAGRRWSAALAARATRSEADAGLELELLAIAMSGGASVDRARRLVREALEANGAVRRRDEHGRRRDQPGRPGRRSRGGAAPRRGGTPATRRARRRFRPCRGPRACASCCRSVPACCPRSCCSASRRSSSPS